MDPILDLLRQALGDERAEWVAATYRLAQTAVQLHQAQNTTTDEIAERRTAHQMQDGPPGRPAM